MFEVLLLFSPILLILLMIIGFTIISRIDKVLDNQEKIMLDLNKLQVSLDENRQRDDNS